MRRQRTPGPPHATDARRDERVRQPVEPAASSGAAEAPANATVHDQPPTSDRFPVVGIGASAGGLDPLRQLLANLPPNAGIAIVVIQHLDPDRESMLAQALEPSATLPVAVITDGMRAAPDRIHVIPAGADLSIERGVLKLVPRRLTGRLHLPIDSFFRALATDQRDAAIGVVLSGAGDDGSEGLRAIRAEGGIAMVQEPDLAEFSSMPEAAIAAGVIDFRGSPEAIAAELVRLRDHRHVAAKRPVSGPRETQDLAAILSLLRERTQVDFGNYKRTTVLRRVERRMALRGTASLASYARSLADDSQETRALMEDILIHVTGFFRDTAAFEALKVHVFEDLEKRKHDGDAIRLWVPGCSTGEEAYSLAISLVETLGDRADRVKIKVFGTDLGVDAVQTARLGIYSESAVVGVSRDRLSRFFEHSAGGYQVRRQIRDLCVFATHDVTRDPPFTRLDLISCRNLLIYFDPDLQRRVIQLLHYCLNPQGYLFLGQSESLPGFPERFAPVDQDHRIFVKAGGTPGPDAHPGPMAREADEARLDPRMTMRRHPEREAERQADHVLLARYGPAGVVVNDRLDIVQFRGRTADYLEQPPGQPQTNLLRMVRQEMVGPLHEVMQLAKSQGGTTRKHGVRVHTGAGSRIVHLVVVPLTLAAESSERYFLVLFEEAPPGEEPAPAAGATVDPGVELPPTAELERLRSELAATRDYLQSVIADHLATTDELVSTNEEMVAGNEELQSINEELQSAHEELQATNEELSTVNEQLRSRNLELDQIANDLVNILGSVEIPVVIVDLQLRVRRFTPAVSGIASFIPEDIGRPIDDLRLRLQVDDLARRIREVIDERVPRDWEVEADDGRWLRMQIRPYHTADHRLDGAVLAFVDVDTLRRMRREAEAARDYAQSIVETVTTPLVVLDIDGRIVSTNAAFRRMFPTPAPSPNGEELRRLDGDLWTQPAVRHALDDSITRRNGFTALEVKTELPQLGRRILSLTGRPIAATGADTPMTLLAIDDVTELRALEAEREQLLSSETRSRLAAEQANRAKDVFLAVLSHELRTPLNSILMSAELLKELGVEDVRVDRASAAIERAVQAQAKLVDDLLDVSRIVSGRLLLDLGPVDFSGVVESAVEVARPSAHAKSLQLAFASNGPPQTVYGDTVRLQQVVNNLLSNAIKFTPHGGRVEVHLEPGAGAVVLTVADSGIGIRAEDLPYLFNRFVQVGGDTTRTHRGLGLGLSIVRHLVEAHGGTVEATSPGEGGGATFRVVLPVGTYGVATTTPAQHATVRRIDGVRVLLVEDDDDTREACAAMLVSLGAEVQALPSAADGLVALEAFRPQVILSDIAMPHEDGYSFIARVRGLPPERGGRIPAAALTALAGEEDRRRVLAAGFQRHVAKPLDAARLAAVVAELIDRPMPDVAAEWVDQPAPETPPGS